MGVKSEKRKRLLRNVPKSSATAPVRRNSVVSRFSCSFLYILSVQCCTRIFTMESVFLTPISGLCVQQERAGGEAARRAGGPTLHPGRFRGALLALRAQPAPQGQAAGSLRPGPLSVLLPSLPLSQEHPSKSHDMKRMFLPWGRCESRDIGGHLGPSVARRQGLRARLRGWAVP